MKSLKYNLAIVLSLLSLLIPIVAIAATLFFSEDLNAWLYGLGVELENPSGTIMLPICGVLLFLGFVLQVPLRNFRIAARRDVEYDEYGLSKSKGNYERLSKAERDAIDLQKTADMERLVNTTAIKKMTKKGPENPMKELDEMIGLDPVKESVKEMVARMQFETEEAKKDKRNKKEALSGRHMVFYGGPGTGKAQPLYSNILTPNGFVKMGDIKVGDSVLTPSGDVAKVLGVFQQGIKKIYEVTLNDGAKCRCSDEHLWKVQSRLDRRFGEYRIVETKDMLDRIACPDDPGRLNYSIQTVNHISMNERQFVIHPYIIGALLGDGCLTEKHGKSIGFTSKDDEILDKFNSLLLPGLHLRENTNKDRTCDYRVRKIDESDIAKENHKIFIDELDRLGLGGTYCHNKFIPEEYMIASYEQRLELLRGLMDTDGYISVTGEMKFGTASVQLANDVVQLVRSLGGWSTIHIKKTGYKNENGDFVPCKDSYVVSVSLTDDTIVPFSLQRKAERMTTKKRVHHKFIQSITYVGEEECQCIYIDHPSHLYITDDYIVTHNTTVARIMTSFLHQYGYIKDNKCIEIDGNFLKAGTESAIKTEMILRHAYGGVLFIDEAYALMDSSDSSGEQVIATLIKQMEDQRGKFILILAGYTNEMKMLIDQNPGFESRIKDYLSFPDYDAIEMRQILEYMAKKNKFTIDTRAYNQFDRLVIRERGLKSFGNARTVRNILDKAIDKHSLNIATGKLPPEMRYVLCEEDFVNLKLGGIGFEKEW